MKKKYSEKQLKEMVASDVEIMDDDDLINHLEKIEGKDLDFEEIQELVSDDAWFYLISLSSE